MKIKKFGVVFLMDVTLEQPSFQFKFFIDASVEIRAKKAIRKKYIFLTKMMKSVCCKFNY